MRNEFEDRLVDLIYAATVGEVSWETFLEVLAGGLPDGRTTLFYHDTAEGRGRYALTTGLSDAEVRAYNEVWAPLNPWMPAASRRPVGVGVVAEQMLPARELRRSEAYNGFLRPIGVETATGVTVERSAGRLFLLSVLTSRGDPEANRPHADALTAIAPHLRRAFRCMRTLADARLRSDAAMEALGVGVAVVGPGGHCRFLSRLAQDIIDRGCALRLDARGRLVATDPALAAVLAGMLGRRPPAEPRRTVLLLGLGGALRVVLVRIVADELTTMLQGPTALVLLDPLTGAYDGARPDLQTLRTLAARYGLTQAETEVLQALGAGLTLDEIARLRNVTRKTVRGQVKALFLDRNPAAGRAGAPRADLRPREGMSDGGSGLASSEAR